MRPAKSNIFDLLAALQTKNPAYFKALPVEEQNTFHPFVVMRWLASVPTDDQILLLNDIANPRIFHIAQVDKGMAMDLLSTCTSGRRSRYNWVKRPTDKKNSPLYTMLREYYGANADIDSLVTTITDDEIRDLCNQLGYQTKETTALLKR